MSFIPIASVELSEEEIAAAVTVLRSGHLIQGERVVQFERAFAEKVGARYAIAVSSGTAALHTAYLCVLEPGDEVIVPTFTHISTASMVTFAMGKPVFCDVDPRTFTLDVADAQRRLTDKTVAIAPVHLYGNACDIEGIIGLATAYKLKIIWDAAQAHRTTYRGRDVGSYDDIACYSFYPTKNMTTGEGGMITTNSFELAEKCRLLRSHWESEKYLHSGLGFNYRMTDIAAAIGIEQLKRLDDLIERRRYNAAYLTEGLKNVIGIEPPLVSEEVEHSYHHYTVVLDLPKLGISRDEFGTALRTQGIGTSIHYPRPVHQQPAFATNAPISSLPVSEELAQSVLSLPVYPCLSAVELDRIILGIKNAVGTEHSHKTPFYAG